MSKSKYLRWLKATAIELGGEDVQIIRRTKHWLIEGYKDGNRFRLLTADNPGDWRAIANNRAQLERLLGVRLKTDKRNGGSRRATKPRKHRRKVSAKTAPAPARSPAPIAAAREDRFYEPLAALQRQMHKSAGH